MINDDENLLRLIWNPLDFKDGKLKGTAFSRGDLIPLLDGDGQPRYVSMDLRSLVNKLSVDWKIDRAKNTAQGKQKEKRVEPRFAEFNCGKIRTLRDSAENAALEVIEAPLLEDADGPGSPENLAHVGLRSLTPDPLDQAEQDVKINELRTLLIIAQRATLSYAEVFGTVADN